MALRSIRSDQFAPCISKTYTTFTAALTLHEAVGESATGAAPAGINHLPASIFVVAEAGDVLAYKDAKGGANSITFTALFYGTLPFTIAEITETTTTATSVTAAWHPSGA
jgi:hypothetical protein